MRSWLVGHQIRVARLVFKQLARAGIGSTCTLAVFGIGWSAKTVDETTHARLPAGLVVQHMHTKARRRFPS